MKHLYVLFIFSLCVFHSHCQEELEGEWVMDSIFDSDVLLQNPTNQISIKICNGLNNGRIVTNGFCGGTSESLYMPSTEENTFIITDETWTPTSCPEDDQGFEIATYNLLGNDTEEDKAITYNITQNGDVTTLELTFTFMIDDISTSVTGYFTKQDPPIDPALIDNWYLQYINTDGVQHDNYLGPLSIEFFDNLSQYCTYQYNGNSICGYFFGDYVDISGNTLSFITLGESASCGGTEVVDYYWYKTRDILSSNGSGASNNITYAISGEGLDQQLTLTNADGDFIVYGKEAPTIALFNKTWYSHSVETSEGLINVPEDIIPTLTLGTGSTILFELFDVNAFGGCNELFGAHNVYWTNENEFRIFVDYQTQEICDDNTYEPLYFSILGNNTNGPFNYDVSEDGSTLTLTNTIGEVLTFGDQPITSPITELQTTWYLYNTNVDGVERYNAQYGDGQPKISFTSNTTDTGLQYTGLSCNDFFGNYSVVDNNTITKLDFSTTLNFCDDNNTDAFSSSYLFDVLGLADETTLSYQITGTGDEAILQLTNTSNFNVATFSRTQQTPDMLGDWFLHYLVVESNQIFNPSISPVTISFNAFPNTSGLFFDGFAICTGYSGDYYFNPQQTFTIDNPLGVTLGDPCSNIEEINFEDAYFYDVLDSDITVEFDYSISGTGDDMSLVITNLSNGNIAVYGRQILSTNESTFTSLEIDLAENPVNDNLKIISSQAISNTTYEVFSITGQLILSGHLKTNQVDVSRLTSGLYVLKISNESKGFQTLKFIKE